MKSLVESIKESTINESFMRAWHEFIEEYLEEFVEDSNLRDIDSDDNDIDEIMQSFKEWLKEVRDLDDDIIELKMERFEDSIREWFLEEDIVNEI